MPETIFCFKLESFHNLRSFVKVSVSLIFCCFLENINSEMMFFFFSYYKENLAAYVIAYSFYSILTSITVTFSATSNIMISLYNGKGNLTDLVKIFWTLIIDSTIIGVISLSILIPLRHVLINTEVKDKNIGNTAARYFTLLMIANYLDCLTEITSNSMKGLRRINTAFFLSLGINCLSVLSLYIGHYYLGGEGIIYGFITNNIMYLFINFTALFFINWQKCIDDSARELHDDAAKLES